MHVNESHANTKWIQKSRTKDLLYFTGPQKSSFDGYIEKRVLLKQMEIVTFNEILTSGLV